MSSKRSFGMYSDEEFEDKSNDFETNSYYEEPEDISDIIEDIIEPTPKEQPKNNYSTNNSTPPPNNTPNSGNTMGNTAKKVGKNVLEQKVYEFSEKIAQYISPKNMSPAARQAMYLAATWGISEVIKKYFDKK